MPTYEYACKSCGEHLEVVQSFSAAPLTECPACSGPLRKVFGAIGIAFKGSGFYKTDNRSTGKKSADSSASSEAKDTASGDSKSESKSDTKSESKSDTKSTTADAKSGSKGEAKSA